VFPAGSLDVWVILLSVHEGPLPSAPALPALCTINKQKKAKDFYPFCWVENYGDWDTATEQSKARKEGDSLPNNPPEMLGREEWTPQTAWGSQNPQLLPWKHHGSPTPPSNTSIYKQTAKSNPI